MSNEYKVVKDRSLENLEREVNQLLKEGWSLRGEVSFSQDGGKWYQAMVLIEERECPPVTYIGVHRP